jgi:hypothetical protein
MDIKRLLYLSSFLLISHSLTAAVLGYKTQTESLEINDIAFAPVIDGISDDECWQNSSWQTIDQVWIPWGNSIDSTDFYGRYKVVWSSTENLLYFLLEINDDTISDGYIPGATAAIYNFDMFELFIDENKSGGYHVFDGTADDEILLGTNAENAFAYHVFTKFPSSGETNEEFIVEDIAGTDWVHMITPDYTSHLPDFILRREGNVSTWEFSLIVYDDTYSETNQEGSRVTLTKDKVMGLTIAFNDDDQPEVDPTQTERDNFIGSVAVSEESYNNHWKIADDFGTVKLVSDITALSPQLGLNEYSIEIYPNPTSGEFKIQIDDVYSGLVSAKLLNSKGQNIQVINKMKNKDFIDVALSTIDLDSGIYFVQVIMNDKSITQKLMMIR